MKATRFTFDNDFDAPQKVDETMEDMPAPPQLFSEEELVAARQAAYVEGLEAGRAEVHADIAERVAQATTAMAAATAALINERETRMDQMREDAVTVAHTIARTLAPALAARQPLAEIEGMVRECLAFCYAEPRLVVRVSEDLVTPMKERVDRIALEQNFPGQIILLGDDRLGGDHCRVEWADGGAERNAAAMQAQVDRLVKRHLASMKAAPTNSDAGTESETGPGEYPDTNTESRGNDESRDNEE